MPPRLLALLLFCLACTARAETAEDAQAQLSGTLSAIKSSTAKQKEFEAKKEVLERELKTLQQDTVAIAQSAKEQEESLGTLEEKAGILEAQKKDKLTTLEARKSELAEALSAMIKLGKLPPEAVIAMPGKLQETLSAARALGVITKAVEEEANSLKAQLHELEALEDKIAGNRNALLHKKADLTVRQKQLAGKIQERGKIHAALSGRAQEEKARMAQLTQKSRTLQDLVDTLGREAQAAAAAEAQDNNAPPERQRPAYKPGKPRKTRPILQAKGKLALPTTGKIIGLYGHAEEGSAFSKGVMIESRASAGVVAPYDGEVVYAGLFRDYGKMVIIRHSGDYHTLLSGMDEINCSPGQFLLEGEPIGSMGKGAGDARPRLYVEMRKGGKPIDPMAWFKG